MDKKYLIGIIIVLILVVAVGIFALGPNNVKQDSKLEILTNDELAVGADFEVQLTDLDKNPISNEVVNVKIGNKTFQATTNNDGKVKLSTDNITSGEYDVNVTFEGNDKFNPTSTSQNLILKGNDESDDSSSSEENSQQYSAQTDTDSSSSGSNGSVHYDSQLNVYYNDQGVVVDPDGQHSMEVGSKYQDLVDRGKNIGENGLE